MIKNFEKDGITYQSFDRNGKTFTRRLVRTNVTHDMSNTRIYQIWKGMKRRCLNPNAPKYEYYGGKGISICGEWLGEHGFENFYKWSIENGYSDELTIDRIDESKDYSPSNCQWITKYENCIKAIKKPRKPKYIYMGFNKSENILVKFYKTKTFEIHYGIDGRRISDCCLDRRKEYEGWIFFRKEISTIEGQETNCTVGDELPLEVQGIQNVTIVILDEDIVHAV